MLEELGVRVRALESDADAHACAAIMAASEPWMTLKRGYDASLAIVSDPEHEAYVAESGERGELVGFMLLDLRGAFTGYIRTVAVREDWRSRGLGRRLIALAEARIHRDSPNVFMCVSSFNERARSLYERLGYAVVGELTDHLVRGHSEWLLRKTLGPIMEWRAPLDRSAAPGDVSSTVNRPS